MALQIPQTVAIPPQMPPTERGYWKGQMCKKAGDLSERGAAEWKATAPLSHSIVSVVTPNVSPCLRVLP